MDQKVLCLAVERSDPVVTNQNMVDSHLSHFGLNSVEIVIAFNATMQSSIQTQRDTFCKQRKGFAESA